MKREVIIWTDKELTREERKNFKRNNPGKRLCFRLRYPNFPIHLSLLVLVVQVTVIFLVLVKILTQ
nr:MAG TPA: hypothetical protein [Caudoviricetes sp.]